MIAAWVTIENVCVFVVNLNKLMRPHGAGFSIPDQKTPPSVGLFWKNMFLLKYIFCLIVHNCIINFSFALNKNTAAINFDKILLLFISIFWCIYTYWFDIKKSGRHVIFIARSLMRSDRHYGKKIPARTWPHWRESTVLLISFFQFLRPQKNLKFIHGGHFEFQ